MLPDPYTTLGAISVDLDIFKASLGKFVPINATGHCWTIHKYINLQLQLHWIIQLLLWDGSYYCNRQIVIAHWMLCLLPDCMPFGCEECHIPESGVQVGHPAALTKQF